MMYLATCRPRLLAFFDFLGCHVGSEVFAYTLWIGLARLLHEIVGYVDRRGEKKPSMPCRLPRLMSLWGGVDQVKSQPVLHSVQWLYARIPFSEGNCYTVV